MALTQQLFVSLDQQWNTVLTTSLTASVSNAIAANAALLTSMLTLWIIISGVLTMFGRMSMTEWVFGATRAAIIGTLLTAAAFNQYIQTPLMTDVPNWLASAVHGGTVTVAAAQFDTLLNEMGVAVAAVQQQLHWTDIGQAIACYLISFFTTCTLIIMFGIWELSRFIIGLLVAIAPFMLGFFLFNATRHFVMGWVSQVVTALATMVLVGIVAALSVTADAAYMQQIAVAADPGVAIQQMLGAIGFFLFGDLLILAVPAIAARIGGGVAHRMGARVAVPSMRAITGAASTMKGIGDRLARAVENIAKIGRK